MSDPIRAAREAAARELGDIRCDRSAAECAECRRGHPRSCAAFATHAVVAFLRALDPSALHALMQRPENAGKTWAEVLAEAVERAGSER